MLEKTLFDQKGPGTKNYSFVPNRILNNTNTNGMALKLACSNFDIVGDEGVAGDYAYVIQANPGSCVTGAPLLATFSIPAPKEISYGTNVSFKSEHHTGSWWANLATSVGFGEPDSTSGRRALDSKDSLFESTEKRLYTFVVTMVATNRNEAQKIATISNALNGFSLPYYGSSGELTLALGLNTRAWSPALWRIGIGPENPNKMNIYPEWTGQTTLSVLTSVKVNTTAAGFPYSIQNQSNNIPYPLFTSVSLTFMDYMPVYRSEFGYDIVMRAAANHRDE